MRYFDVGLCYERGYGVARSIDEAIQWYEKSAFEGKDPEGFLALGRLYYFGLDVPRSFEKAKWYIEAIW